MARDRLSQIFRALADPTRRAMLARLIDGDATVSELAAPFDLSQPAISKHLKVLEQAGLITCSRSAQWRFSSIDVTGLQEVADWVEPYRRFWDENLDRLDAHLKRIQEQQLKEQQ